MEAEIEAQFSRLQEAGIHPTHVDSHHHLHVHPVIFRMVCRIAARRGVEWIRMPLEPAASLPGGFFFTRTAEWGAFLILKSINAKVARGFGLNYAGGTGGLSRMGDSGVQALLKLARFAKGPVAEIYSHPDLSTERGRRELESLRSSAVANALAEFNAVSEGYKKAPKRYKILEGKRACAPEK